jgi:hypothetical protein
MSGRHARTPKAHEYGQVVAMGTVSMRSMMAKPHSEVRNDTAILFSARLKTVDGSDQGNFLI